MPTNNLVNMNTGIGAALGQLGGLQAQATTTQAQNATAYSNYSYATYPYQQYSYWPYWGYTYPPSATTEADKLIALYKKQFGKEWKKYFAATVKIEL